MELSSILKILRKQNKITQTELGKVVNLSKQSISSYENNTSFPPHDILQALANYFDVSVDYLLGRTTERNPVRIVKETKDLLQYLNEGEKEQFLALGIQQIVLKKEVTDPGRLKELMLKAMKIMRAIDDDN
ncbi:MAG: helix-turn-helix domain-containing protein [Alkaliphilus sp.]